MPIHSDSSFSSSAGRGPVKTFFKVAPLAAALALSSAVSSADAAAMEAHYLVMTLDSSQGTLDVNSHRLVELNTPMTTVSDDAIEALDIYGNKERHWATVRLYDESGELAYQTVTSVPRWLRGEFHNDGPKNADNPRHDQIDGHHFEIEEHVFTVRVPDIGGGSTLEVIPNFADIEVPWINLDETLKQLGGNLIDSEVNDIPGWEYGPAENRLDILIIAEGYTADQYEKFQTDAEQLAYDFIGISPYKEYSNYMNIRTAFVASNEAGADTPYCPSDRPIDSNEQPTGEDNDDMFDTAFNASFCTRGIWRLLNVDQAEVFAAGAKYADWDDIMVVVNSEIYGGAGGTFPVTSIEARAHAIAQHEFAHSFTGLADEYEDPAPPGTLPCSDINTDPGDDCEPNVTDETDPGMIKWGYWIEPTTPIPFTQEDSVADPLAAGHWPGARYVLFDEDDPDANPAEEGMMYRQCDIGMMRAFADKKNQPTEFCYVGREAFIKKLYNGFWSGSSWYDAQVPNIPFPFPTNLPRPQRISNIEVNTQVPLRSYVVVPYRTTQQFSAQLLGPKDGSDLYVAWYLNGRRQAFSFAKNGDTVSYNFTPPDDDNHTIELEVTDLSLMIHLTQASSLLSSFKWEVEVR